MSEFKTWEQMSRKEQLESIIWDAYKDAYGIRPRHMNLAAMTEAELEAELSYLDEVISNNIVAEAEFEQKMIAKFECDVATTIALGAGDRKTALRWIMDASGCEGDWEYLCYERGLPFNYFKEAV